MFGIVLNRCTCSVVVLSANALDFHSPIWACFLKKCFIIENVYFFVVVGIIKCSQNVAKQTESVAGVHQSSSHGLLSQGGRVELRAWSWRHSPPGRDPPQLSNIYTLFLSRNGESWWISQCRAFVLWNRSKCGRDSSMKCLCVIHLQLATCVVSMWQCFTNASGTNLLWITSRDSLNSKHPLYYNNTNDWSL